jgi:hypothetical protein
MNNQIISLRNKLDFNIRQWVRWKRSGLELSHVPKVNVFNHMPAGEKNRAKEIESRLLRTYDLQDVVLRGDEDNYRVNLYYLDLLENAFEKLKTHLPEEVNVVDIGCSSWFYVRALYAFLSGWKPGAGRRKVKLTGYEIDPFKPIFNFHSRYDYGHAFSERLENVRYIPEAFHTQGESYDMVCQFFPFIFSKDHLEWGLPQDLFFPKVLLQDAWLSLKKNGVLLVVNQGSEEHDQQKEWLAGLGIQPGTTFKMESALFDYGIDHYVVGAVKK